MKKRSGSSRKPRVGEHWVFHRAALGDSVLLWPMLRQWRIRGLDVVLVSDGAKARLAAAELRIRAEDAESPRFNALWVPNAAVEPRTEAVTVAAYLGRRGEATQTWMKNARAMFPNAAVAHRTERPTRSRALRLPLPQLLDNRRGPIIMHIGAGAESRRWHGARWVELAARLQIRGPVRLIAGEVEREQLSADEIDAFLKSGGQFLESLDQLAADLKKARLLIAADTGPGHLAAQLGIPVLSLFGPSDPIKWAPIGPLVKVLAPDTPRAMDWLEVDRVVEAVGDLIR